MGLNEILTLVAIFLSPVIAVQVTEVLQRRRAKRERQLYIFRVLMATRAASLTTEHVQALNLIDIEFNGKDAKPRAVRDAWKALLDHLNTSQNTPEVWAQRREDLFVELAFAMATLLDYDFDRTLIRRGAYYPRGLGEQDQDAQTIRKGLTEILAGRASFPIYLTGMAATQTPGAEPAPLPPSPAEPPRIDPPK